MSHAIAPSLNLRTGISLNAELAALHASRVASWKPEDLQVNIDQRQTLVDGFDPQGSPQVGDVLENFLLPEVDGGTVSLDLLVSRGRTVLVFFRFAGCPACNLALPHYQRELYPALQEAGVSLAAISPQPVERLVAIKTRHDLSFPVLSDTNSDLARRLGLLYQFDAPSRAAAASKGSSIRELNGTDAWELPQPAIIIVGPGRIVQFIDISPDWLVRTEAQTILDALEL